MITDAARIRKNRRWNRVKVDHELFPELKDRNVSSVKSLYRDDGHFFTLEEIQSLLRLGAITYDELADAIFVQLVASEYDRKLAMNIIRYEHDVERVFDQN
jgi:hypothetical protein